TGAAVVATSTEGAQEIIRRDETGLLVPISDVQSLADAVSGLLQDEAKRIRIGAAAQEQVETQFSIGRMIDETEEIYRAETAKA
ncbi:MAG: glycosyltransferase, partial [Acidobacteriota bacterium]|nr:glycosyltransferase [Acidobacteriota bacterium]